MLSQQSIATTGLTTTQSGSKMANIHRQCMRERIRTCVVEHEDLADSTETPDTNSTQVVPQSGEAEVRFIVPFYQPQ